MLMVEGDEIAFQDYFVARRHDVAVTSVRFAGAERARPGPEVLSTLAAAEAIVICPSNPIGSIGPVLAVPGIRDAIAARRDDTVAVSPIVAGAALKGPADRLLTELGHEATVAGVARIYAPFAAALVIDPADRDLAGAVEAAGMRPVIAPSIMSSPGVAQALAEAALAALG
jgi:LPPG:FO 2-phospho-L-lactate transferase